VSDFLIVRVVGSGNSIVSSIFLIVLSEIFSEEGFIIILLLIVFVELEVVSILQTILLV
jgi:hypothetical protein